MRRRIAIVAAAAAASAAGIAAMPSAQAQSVCVDLYLDLNGNEQAQSLCLPPEGGETPGLPGLPGLPPLP